MERDFHVDTKREKGSTPFAAERAPSELSAGG